MKSVRADNGGEYRGPFENYCKAHGIRLEKTPTKTPQLNGVAKRMKRTIEERIRCMLSHAKLPKSFWGEAMRTAVDLINLSPAAILNRDVPNRVWIGKDVSYGCLRFLAAGHSFMFLKMRGPSLMIRQNHVFSWDMVMESLGIDYGIQ